MPGAYEIVRPHVPEGEELIWAGFPRRGLVLRTSDLWLVPISVVATALPAYGAYEILSEPASLASKITFGLAALTIAVVGLYLVVGRFFADHIYRSCLTYGVTKRNVIIVCELFGSRATIISIPSIRGLRIEENRPGRGTIHLAEGSAQLTANGWDIWHPVLGRPPQLFEIEDPRKVIGFIRRATQR